MFSYWDKTLLEEHDYLIIGGGITGLSTAASLLEKNAGARVTVLERGLIPTGASTRNAGFVCFGSPTELLYDLRTSGDAKTLELVEMRIKGMRRLLNRLPPNEIGYEKCGGYELLPPEDSRVADRLDYLNSLLRPVVGTKVFLLSDEKINSFGFSKDAVAHLVENSHEGQLDPGKMMRALHRYVTSLGGLILTGVRADHIEETSKGVNVVASGNLFGEPVIFSGRQLAVCTNAFVGSLLPKLDVVPGRGQVIITSPIEKLAFRGTFHMEQGFYYFRDYGNRVVIGGGRNLDLQGEETTAFGNTPNITGKLEALLQKTILPGKNFTTEMMWSGIMGFTPDKRPLVRRLTDKMVCGVGLSGMGIALGSEVGEQLAEILTPPSP